jgi:hypothetical protein
MVSLNRYILPVNAIPIAKNIKQALCNPTETKINTEKWRIKRMIILRLQHEFNSSLIRVCTEAEGYAFPLAR